MTELVFILDRSGSMSGLEGDTIGGFNSMLEQQKLIAEGAGAVAVAAAMFDKVRVEGKNVVCLVSGGNMDSMVNHYTAAKKKRSDDFYSPGGKAGYRPARR